MPPPVLATFWRVFLGKSVYFLMIFIYNNLRNVLFDAHRDAAILGFAFRCAVVGDGLNLSF